MARIPAPVDIDSLGGLRQKLRELTRRNVLIPVDDAWVKAFADADGPLHGTRLAQELGARAGAATVPAATELVDYVRSVVPGSRPREFMAPMCCPLTKVDLRRVRDPDNGYLVTEKSDGLRALLVSVAVPNYVRWVVLDDGGNPSPTVQFGLYDQAMIEGAFGELTRDGAESKAGIGTSFGPSKLVANDTADGGVFYTLRRAMPSNPAQIEELRLDRRRDTRHFTYFFDRSMAGTYLLLDEVPFPANLSHVVLDGELLLSFPPPRPGAPPLPPRCLFAVFDVLSYQERRGDKYVREVISDAPMSERYEMIQEEVLGPAAERAAAQRIPMPQSIVIMRKVMVPVSRIDELLKDVLVIRAPAADGAPVTADGDAKYFYARTGSYNDGFIFTPEKFDIVAGSIPTQYKWKWPGKLSVDFLARPSPGSDLPPQDDGPCERLSLELLFKQRGTKGQADRSGHVFMMAEDVFNPAKIKWTDADHPNRTAVVECSIARGLKTGRVAWRIDKLRADKTEANSMIAAFSVLESIAEHLTLRRVVDGLGVKVDEALLQRFDFSVPAPSNEDETPAIPLPRMLIRARPLNGRAYPSLQWQVRLKEMTKSSLTCNHRPVEQCYGLHERCPAEVGYEDPLSSPLVGRCLIELGNNGGCVGWSDTSCEVAYDAVTGRWVIGSIAGADKKLKDLTWCTNIFEHLSALAKAVVGRGGTPPPIELIEENRIDADDAEAADAAPAVAVLAPSDAHYALRTRELADGTGRNALQKHNNWVKAVLIAKAVNLAKETGTGERPFYLDLCCGRGGDLHKIAHCNAQRALLVDSCFEAVVEAAGRYCVGKGLSVCSVLDKGLPMGFRVSDCFNDKATWPLVRMFIQQYANLQAQGGFDLVSCQFSMHYAFGREKQVRGFLNIVSQALRPGGVFAATTVDDSALASWRARCGDTFGNESFQVAFLPEDAKVSEYGPAYRISVLNSVVNEMEYVVEWDRFVALAAEYGLELVETKNFSDVAPQDGTADLVEHLTAADPAPADGPGTAGGKRQRTDPRADLTKDDLEAVGIFRTVLMRKVAAAA